ncbi:hypothetical protein LDENG_00272390, partial [Lucifuga dentata]
VLQGEFGHSNNSRLQQRFKNRIALLSLYVTYNEITGASPLVHKYKKSKNNFVHIYLNYIYTAEKINILIKVYIKSVYQNVSSIFIYRCVYFDIYNSSRDGSSNQ